MLMFVGALLRKEQRPNGAKFRNGLTARNSKRREIPNGAEFRTALEFQEAPNPERRNRPTAHRSSDAFDARRPSPVARRPSPFPRPRQSIARPRQSIARPPS